MKKLISILLVLTMIFSISAMMSYAAEESVSFIIASDTHYSKITETVKRNVTVAPAPASVENEETYAHAVATGQLRYESEAVLDAFLSQAAASDEKYVIISGDLTDSGSETDAAAMVEKLKAFETSSKKSVFVIPGNHDVISFTKAQFKEYYKDFGYDKAIAQDSASASYTVDIDGGYRLLMIDTTGEKLSGHQLDEARVNWIKAQCQKAKSDKKHLVAVMHHNLLQHFAFDFMHEGAVISNIFGLEDLFCEYDVKYVFSGHSHAQDIMKYENDNGKVFYEVVTAALNLFPVSYRVVDFSKSGVNFETKAIKKIDTSKFASYGIDSDAIAKADADFMGYAHIMYIEGIKKFFTQKISDEILCDIFDVTLENNEEIYHILRKMGGKLENVIEFPLYTKDLSDIEEERVSISIKKRDSNGNPVTQKDADGNEVSVMIEVFSLQEIVESYGGRMVDSVYKNLLDLAALLYEIHITGREGLRLDSTEYSVTVNSLAATMNYCLYAVSTDEYAALLKFLVNRLEPSFFGQMPKDLYANIAGIHDSFEQNILFITYMLSPFIKSAFTDDDPEDNNVKLEAYKSFEVAPQNPPQQEKPKEEPKEDTSFRAKFVAFFDKIAEFFRMIFSVLTFQGVF